MSKNPLSNLLLHAAAVTVAENAIVDKGMSVSNIGAASYFRVKQSEAQERNLDAGEYVGMTIRVAVPLSLIDALTAKMLSAEKRFCL